MRGGDETDYRGCMGRDEMRKEFYNFRGQIFSLVSVFQPAYSKTASWEELDMGEAARWEVLILPKPILLKIVPNS